MSEQRADAIWIIGASSGIGRALAVAYAARGAVLVLSSRDESALSALNEELGGRHHVIACDVADMSSVQRAVESVRQAGLELKRVLFMAAVYTPGTIRQMESQTMSAMVDVNLKGAFHVVEAVLPFLQAQQGVRAQLALCGSVAGYRGLPKSQPYGALKAAIINLAESLRAEEGDWLDVRLINPGFVQTPMTDKNRFTMPARITPEAAAQAIVRGLDGGSFELHFPKRFTLFIKCLKWLPDTLYFLLARQLR
jgi:short-subunit dehydrogenase